MNPCGDPPGGAGTAQTVPTAQGGRLRAQDLRTPGDPVGLNGSLIRIDPMTGAAAPGNPLSGHSDANARRMLAYGMRNPFRMAIRPGTNDVFMADVGGGWWEEIDRVQRRRGPGEELRLALLRGRHPCGRLRSTRRSSPPGTP